MRGLKISIPNADRIPMMFQLLILPTNNWRCGNRVIVRHIVIARHIFIVRHIVIVRHVVIVRHIFCYDRVPPF